MGRHPKPDLTPEELAATEGKTNRIAAAIVSDMRGANVVNINALERYRRRVSHSWIRQQRVNALRGNIQACKNTGGAGAASPMTNPPSVEENQWAMGNSGPRNDRAMLQSPAVVAGATQQENPPKTDNQDVAADRRASA